MYFCESNHEVTRIQQTKNNNTTQQKLISS